MKIENRVSSKKSKKTIFGYEKSIIGYQKKIQMPKLLVFGYNNRKLGGYKAWNAP